MCEPLRMASIINSKLEPSTKLSVMSDIIMTIFGLWILFDVISSEILYFKSEIFSRFNPFATSIKITFSF